MQGLSRALYEQVNFDKRGVTSIDWVSYPMVRFKDAPWIHVNGLTPHRRAGSVGPRLADDRLGRAGALAGARGDRERVLRRHGCPPPRVADDAVARPRRAQERRRVEPRRQRDVGAGPATGPLPFRGMLGRVLQLDASLGLDRGEVELVDGDPRWADAFAPLAAELARALDGAAIEHVGSTAVPGLRAKPILDVAVGVPSPSEDDLRRRLEPLGLDVARRRAQRRRPAVRARGPARPPRRARPRRRVRRPRVAAVPRLPRPPAPRPVRARRLPRAEGVARRALPARPPRVHRRQGGVHRGAARRDV